MIEPFTEEDIEKALELFEKEWDECNEVEKQQRTELLARLRSQENSKIFLSRLTLMAQPRDI
jgi:hypothetical protein